MLSVQIKDTGVIDLLAKIQQRLKHLQPAMGLIGEVVQGSIEQNFTAQGRPHRWADLSPVTKALRAKRGKWPGQILRVSGAMSRIRYQAHDDRVELSSGMPYGATHHFGARKGSFGTVIAHIGGKFRNIGMAGRSGATLYEEKKLVRRISHRDGGKWRQSGSAGRSGATHYTEVKRRIEVRAHTRKMTLPWGNIPARPFMLVQNEDWDDMREVLGKFLLDAKK